MEIEITIPYLVAGKKATKFVVEPIGFVRFAELAVDAANESGPTKRVFSTLLMRERTKVVLDDGKQVPLDAATLHSMPRPVARPLIKFFDSEGDAPADETEEDKAARLATGAQILSDGDGLTAPVLVKLGKPIKGAGDKEISELEFLAKTYGDVELVLAATNELNQTIELIRSVAKPVGMLTLPTWALPQVAVADGLFIQKNVLNRFLE